MVEIHAAPVYPAQMFTPRRLFWAITFVAFVATLTGGVWGLAYRTALDQLGQRAESDLTLASDRLTGQLFRYRELVVVLSDHPVLTGVLTGGPNGGPNGEADGKTSRDLANDLLRRMADKTGARRLELVDRNGQIIASSRETAGPNDRELPPQIALAPLTRALNGALGTTNRVEHPAAGPARRLFSFAAPVFGNGTSQGAVIVEVEVWLFEQNWPTSDAAIYFVNKSGQVIVSNRSDLTLRDRTQPDFLRARQRLVSGHDIWTLQAGPYLPNNALHRARDLPVINLQAEILLDTAPARAQATLQAAVAAALSLVFGAFLFLAAERRRVLAISLAQEEAANLRLETRVAKRTKALSAANADLLQAQADLVQAGKLSALGQMSAGISHELNQPLMAIRSFAENAAVFLERDKPENAAKNLRRISDLAHRMGRIIKNLRAFARNESEPVGKVDLLHVIEIAIEMTGQRLKSDKIALEWSRAPGPVYASGGEVRLVQVFVNLINNAADAMADQDAPRLIQISVDTGPRLSVCLRDTGPGVADPGRIFEPFFTTKAVGNAEGMGLGLSISYGLVQSFGGNIRCVNAPGGGAIFAVDLEYWQAEKERVA